MAVAQQQMFQPLRIPTNSSNEILMQGGSVAIHHFDVHNSSPQLTFLENSSVVKRTAIASDPTASRFCFAALVPVTDRQGRFAVRLDRGVLGKGGEGVRAQEGMFLGVGIAKKDRFGAEGFGRGDYSWGLSNRRNDDYPAVFTSSGGIAENRLPTLKVGDVVSVHWYKTKKNNSSRLSLCSLYSLYSLYSHHLESFLIANPLGISTWALSSCESMASRTIES